MDSRAHDLLVELRALWIDWRTSRGRYAHTVLPNLMTYGPRAGRTAAEQSILFELRTLLSDADWHNLAVLLDRIDDREAQEVLDRRAAERALAQEKEENRLAAEAAARALAQEAKANEEAETERMAQSLKAQLARDYVHAREWWRRNDPWLRIDNTRFDQTVAEFISEWCSNHLAAPDAAGERRFTPDFEQALVIGSVHEHTLVEARAGSGKTATIVARAAFLVRGAHVDPSEILMLAFNGAAAAEMRDRVEKLLPGGQVPHVMTFHALAYRIVHPSENLIFDQSDTMKAQSRIVQDVIDELIRDPQHQSHVREVMLSYFRKDWGEVLRRGDNLSAADQVEFRRHLRDETINGDFVRSYGEKAIANTLAENGLRYSYEKNHWWNGHNYKPDFTVYDENERVSIIIEYFGILGSADYDRVSEKKREYWSTKPDIAFLEYKPKDIASPGFRLKLLADLSLAGARPTPVGDDEIWRRIRKRAIDRFTEAVKTLVSRARQRRWDNEALRANWQLIASTDPDLDRFIELAAHVLDRYELRLRTESKEDFTGLMWRAIDAVRSDETEFGRAGRTEGDLRQIRFLMVDEFQDFSLMFHELLQEIMDVANNVHVLAVGDEWQAINEFAGSTTEYFTNFERHFPRGRRLRLSTNRRSDRDIVKVGNMVMDGRGFESRALKESIGQIREFDADSFNPSALEENAFGANECFTPMLVRLILSHLQSGRSVAVLDRLRRHPNSVRVNDKERRFGDIGELGAFIREILKVTEPELLRFSSVHGFKGQEADAVILLNVDGRNYPLIHPTWVLFQVFGDTPLSLTEAERRLFYVAVSRPRFHLDVITSRRDECAFWPSPRARSARLETGAKEFEWDRLPDAGPAVAHDAVEIRVFISGAPRFDYLVGYLKNKKFRFHKGMESYWLRIFSASEYTDDLVSRSNLTREPGVRIQAWRAGRLLVSHPREIQPW